MAGVHGLEQVEGLGSAHLADDDAFRAHTQAVLTRSRIVMAPVPSRFGGRVSSRTVWGC